MIEVGSRHLWHTNPPTAEFKFNGATGTCTKA
jgi:hypothetical protein